MAKTGFVVMTDIALCFVAIKYPNEQEITYISSTSWQVSDTCTLSNGKKISSTIIWAASSEFGTYRLCEQRRFRWPPEPPLLAHTSSESRGTFRQEARSLAALNGWAWVVKIRHDGMLEDTNSLDAAHLIGNSSQHNHNAFLANGDGCPILLDAICDSIS